MCSPCSCRACGKAVRRNEEKPYRSALRRGAPPFPADRLRGAKAGDRAERAVALLSRLPGPLRRGRRHRRIRIRDRSGRRRGRGTACAYADGDAAANAGGPGTQFPFSQRYAAAGAARFGQAGTGGPVQSVCAPFRRGAVAGGLLPDADAHAAGRRQCREHHGQRPGAALSQDAAVHGGGPTALQS